jgi:hypothetical protein
MNMIERVARAIYRTLAFGNELDKAEKEIQTLYKNIAKAAIEAMREPTYEMLEPVTNADGCFKAIDPKKAYQVIIDAALKDSK